MQPSDCVESVSDRRVRLYHLREGAARTLSSILTATGAVEALNEKTAIRGVFSVIVGLALEKDAKDPRFFTTAMVLPAVVPAVFKLFQADGRDLTSAIEAFVIALKCACFYMTLRLLFMSRRLRQLGELKKLKEVE